MDTAPFRQLPGGNLPPARAFFVKADDGVRLRLALWQAESPQGSVLLFPGRTEYVERYARVAALLNAAGLTVLAIDWRGQGMSDRLQADPRPGHIGEFADYQRDVVEMAVAASELNLPRPWHLLTHSMGGCIGLAALYNELPVATATFSSPMWGINLRQIPRGFALCLAQIAGRLAQGGRAVPGSGAAGTYALNTAFAGNLLTEDAPEWCRTLSEAVAWPELTIGGASFDWLHKALGECARLAALPSPDYPALISVGDKEQVVKVSSIRERASGWKGARLLEVANSRHQTMMETPDVRNGFFAAFLDHIGAS